LESLSKGPQPVIGERLSAPGRREKKVSRNADPLHQPSAREDSTQTTTRGDFKRKNEERDENACWARYEQKRRCLRSGVVGQLSKEKQIVYIVKNRKTRARRHRSSARFFSANPWSGREGKEMINWVIIGDKDPKKKKGTEGEKRGRTLRG